MRNWENMSYEEYNTYDNNGYCPATGLYKSRYYAKKAALSYEVIVKMGDGYKIMDARDYQIWKNQQ
jgi:hypothetical protein